MGRSPVCCSPSGGYDLASFAGLEPVAFVIRTVEDPRPLPFRPLAIIRARGPFTAYDEEALLSANAIAAPRDEELRR